MEITNSSRSAGVEYCFMRLSRKPLGRSGQSSMQKIRALFSRIIQSLIALTILAIPKGGDLKMASQKHRANPLRAVGGQSSNKNNDGSAVKSIHLVLDISSYTRLVWLQGALKASSFTEVLRRALDAYEIFDPEGLATQNTDETDDIANSETNADVKHLYLDISKEMKKQLEDEKSATGRTYKVTISRALCVLMQLVRQRSALIATLKGGDDIKDSNINDQKLVESHQKLLAVI